MSALLASPSTFTSSSATAPNTFPPSTPPSAVSSNSPAHASAQQESPKYIVVAPTRSRPNGCPVGCQRMDGQKADLWACACPQCTITSNGTLIQDIPGCMDPRGHPREPKMRDLQQFDVDDYYTAQPANTTEICKQIAFPCPWSSSASSATASNGASRAAWLAAGTAALAGVMPNVV